MDQIQPLIGGGFPLVKFSELLNTKELNVLTLAFNILQNSVCCLFSSWFGLVVFFGTPFSSFPFLLLLLLSTIFLRLGRGSCRRYFAIKTKQPPPQKSASVSELKGHTSHGEGGAQSVFLMNNPNSEIRAIRNFHAKVSNSTRIFWALYANVFARFH